MGIRALFLYFVTKDSPFRGRIGMKRIWVWLMAASVGVLLSACGGGGSSTPDCANCNQSMPGASISGLAVKGAISNGTVTAYAVTASGTRGGDITSTTTSGSGHYTLSLGSYTGSVFLELTGGSYIDEATGQTINVPSAAGSGLQAVVSNVTTESTLEVQITPLTTLAAARAHGMVGGFTATNIDAANQQVGTYFGGLDILGTAPINPLIADSAGGATQDAINYGLILAGLSEQAQTLGLTSPFELVTALVQDFSDGSFNGQSGSTPVQLNGSDMNPSTGTTDLAMGISGFSWDASHNLSGGAVSATLVASIANQSSNLSYKVGTTVSGLIGTVVLNNNGADSLTLSTNGVFTFATAIADGNAYNITVETQPAGQSCTVFNGTGTVNASNVTNVSVSCVTGLQQVTAVCNPIDPGSPTVASGVRIPTTAKIGAGTAIHAGATIGEYANTGVCSIIGENARLGGYSKIGEGAGVGPDASLGSSSSIGVGAIVASYSSLMRNASLGDNSSLGTGSAASRIGSDARVGANTIIGDGTVIGSSARIGDYVIIGNNVHIGNSAKVCDGAVIREEGAIAGGTKYGCY